MRPPAPALACHERSIGLVSGVATSRTLINASSPLEPLVGELFPAAENADARLPIASSSLLAGEPCGTLTMMPQRQNAQKSPFLAAGAVVVSSSALCGIVLCSIGCIIPTPLDRAPAPVNYQPAFVTAHVVPAFGPASESINSGITIALGATDPNHDDILTVKLFTPAATGGFQSLDIGTTLMIPSPPDADDPDLRLGSIETALCLRAQPGQQFEIYAFVADRPFTGATTMAEGGLTDSNHWQFTCTSM